MVKARMRVKGLHPLQKPWISSRFKMARSGQERQRLKKFLLLDKVRKEPLLPSAKIRSRWRLHQIFGATALRFPIVGTIRSHSITANTILFRLLLELVWGFSIPASSSHPSLVPSRLVQSQLKQGCGPGAFTSSSLPSPVPSRLAQSLLEQN